MRSNQKGYRGYIFSRPIDGHRVPQSIQNMVIRDYAERHGLVYLLSGTEYLMEGSYLILGEILSDLEGVDGIILYTRFMLPADAGRRHAIYRSVLAAGCTLHAAVEDVALKDEADIERWESLRPTTEGALDQAPPEAGKAAVRLRPGEAGFRGYLFGPPIDGHIVPRHIQDLVVRKYARRKGIDNLLPSVTEDTVEKPAPVLEEMLSGLGSGSGVILYTMFLLPHSADERRAIYGRVLAAKSKLHAAVEGFVLEDVSDVEQWENVLLIADVCRVPSMKR
jgi:sporadic carbohydrate cluster protein (TIGR04323 family)